MSHVNPYAAPTSEHFVQPSAAQGGIYQHNGLLVVAKNSQLPIDRCLKSGELAESKLHRSLAWHHPAYFLVIFLNVLIFIIVASIVGKRQKIIIGLSRQWARKRRMRILIAWSVVLIGLASLITPAFFATPGRANDLGGAVVGLLICGGIAMILFGAIYGIFACRLVYAAKITNKFAFVKGVHPDYLNTFPQFDRAWDPSAPR